MFKLQWPSKYSSFDAIHLSRHFCPCSKQFLNSLILRPFSASAVFCFTSSTLAKCFPLRTFFIQGNKNKVTRGKIRWIGRVGHQESCHFRSKTAQHLNTQCLLVCAGALRNSPIMKWANALKESSKKFTVVESSLSQRQLVQWNRWVPRTLT